MTSAGVSTDRVAEVASADDLAAWAAGADAFEGLWTPFGPIDVDALSDRGRVDALLALERLRSWVDAQQFALLSLDARAAARDGDDKEFVRDEVGAALRWSATVVADRWHVAQRLTDRFPATLLALRTGAISERHARALVEATDRLADDVAAQVESAVLARAGDQTPSTFRRAVRKAAMRVDPRDAETSHAQARTDRRVSVTEVGDGMSEFWALLPSEDAATLFTALTAIAAGGTGMGDTAVDPRTIDQRRADALVGLAALRLADGPLPTWRGRRPTVQVTVSASTLLGLDDQPAELDGFGPVTADVARRIAADPSGTWRRLLTDDAGVLVDCSRTYRPSAALSTFVIARDRTCRFPGCPQPARRCEIDHQHPWECGGPTCADNLECLCARHHHLKHEAGWTVSGDPAGELIWTSPTGHTYRSPPPLYE